jgi:cytoskeletal protein RodZ
MPASSREDALKELGRMAREKREDANLSLEEIYERTRVRLEYLQGIEDGNYRGFPDLVYIKGFVRTYLSVIGAEDLKDEFISWLNKEEAPKERRLPPTNVLGNGTSPTKGFKPASHLWLFAILFLALAGSGYYVWYSWSSNPFIIDIRQFQRETPPGESAEKVPSGDIPSQDTPLALLSTDNPAGSLLSILPVSHNIEPEPEPEPLKPSLSIRARGDVWTRVRIGEKVVFTKTMKSGEEASWELTAEARVTYGRPNMAEVTLNGKALGPANPRGSKTSETYAYRPDGTYTKVQPQSQ